MHKVILCLMMTMIPLLLSAFGKMGGVPDRGSVMNDALHAEAQPDMFSSRRSFALGNFIRAVMQRGTEEQRIDWLLMTLDGDPGLNSAYILLNAYAKDSVYLEKIARGMLGVANLHPEHPLLVEQALHFALRCSVCSDSLKDLVERAVMAQIEPARLDARSYRAFCRILKIHAANLLRDNRTDDAYDFFRRFGDSEFFPEHLWMQELSADFYNRAARRADRKRRFFGLLPSDREILERCRNEYIEGMAETDNAISDLNSLGRRAVAYLQLHLADDAVRIVEHSAEAPERQVEPRYLLARVLFMARRYGDALTVVGDLLKMMPGDRSLLALQANAALRHGDYDLTVNSARDMLKTAPGDSNAEFLLIAGLLAADRIREAESEINSVEDGELQWDLNNMLHRKTRNYKQMLDVLRNEEKQQHGKANDVIYGMMLLPAEQNGDVALLNYCWNKLASMKMLDDPKNANSVGYVATTLDVRLDEAEKLIRYALEDDPECGAYLDSMAWLQYRLGEYEAASDYIRLALSSPDELDSPGRGVMLDHAGDIMMKLGNLDAAYSYYKKAVEESFDFDVDGDAIRAKLSELSRRR